MNKFMKAAIDEAYVGVANGHGGPFGCVIVKDNDIIGKGHNEVIKNADCTCHGEIMAIKDACRNLQTFDLNGCELYTTSAPCPMCNGAIKWANIQKVYVGCNIDDAEQIGFRDKVFYENALIVETVERDECLKLFDYYAKTEHQKY